MDQALVEHAEDEVDDEQRRDDEDWRALQRCCECLGVALEAGLQRERRGEAFFTNPQDVLTTALHPAPPPARKRQYPLRTRRALLLRVRRPQHHVAPRGLKRTD